MPFEVASLFLLVAMIGAIVIGKRELSALEEETAPRFILDRVETARAKPGALSYGTTGIGGDGASARYGGNAGDGIARRRFVARWRGVWREPYGPSMERTSYVQ